MDKIITENEAYNLYLKNGYEEVMPFRSYREFDYINYLYNMGITVLDYKDTNLDD